MITSAQRQRLTALFADMLNYASQDPLESIDPLTYISPEGDTALHVACWRKDKEAVTLLLAAGIDVNAKGDMGQTPLHAAGSTGDAEICDVLIQHGADRESLDEFGRRPDLPGPSGAPTR